MPPVDTSPQSVIRYLTRLLAAMTLEAGGELRIPQKLIRKVAEETNRQALFEDTDSEADELVLRFGTKNSSVYPIEPDKCDSPKSPSTTSPQPRSEPQASTRPPLTDNQLAGLELKLKQERMKRAVQRERKQSDSSSPSELNFPV